MKNSRTNTRSAVIFVVLALFLIPSSLSAQEMRMDVFKTILNDYPNGFSSLIGEKFPDDKSLYYSKLKFDDSASESIYVGEGLLASYGNRYSIDYAFENRGQAMGHYSEVERFLSGNLDSRYWSTENFKDEYTIRGLRFTSKRSSMKIELSFQLPSQGDRRSYVLIEISKYSGIEGWFLDELGKMEVALESNMIDEYCQNYRSRQEPVKKEILGFPKSIVLNGGSFKNDKNLILAGKSIDPKTYELYEKRLVEANDTDPQAEIYWEIEASDFFPQEKILELVKGYYNGYQSVEQGESLHTVYDSSKKERCSAYYLEGSGHPYNFDNFVLVLSY